MARRARVWMLHDKGFEVGPHRDHQCDCGHPWGDHFLHPATDNPLDGGTWSCPNDCRCFGTWDVPGIPDRLRHLGDGLA